MDQIINHVINNYPSTTWILLFFGGIFILAIRKQIEIFYLNLFNKISTYLKKRFRSHIFTRRDLFRENKIQELLFKLRLENNADRANIFIFHNGGVFSTDLPQFKISKTHESIKPGVSSTFKQDQDIRCSSVIDIIKPLWEKDTVTQGVYFSSLTGDLHGTKPCCEKVYYTKVEELQAGYAKSDFNEKGVKYSFIAPLRGTKEQIIGYISLEYCTDINVDSHLKECLGMCQIASDIRFYLNQIH